MITFRMYFEGEAILARDLDGIAERAEDMRPAWPAVIAYFRQMVEKAFATEGASTGQKWPGLKLATAQDRLRKGFAGFHPILQRTGELKRSIDGGGGGFVEATTTSLAIGSNDPVFWYHQSRKPRKRLPRRAPVLTTAADRTELMRPVALHLRGLDPSAPVIRRSAAP
jgi:hypothetical protein